MSFNRKIILFCLLVIVGLPYFGYRYYRFVRPKYIAPPAREEITLTIIPGWNLRQVAEYLVRQGLASSTSAVYEVTGKPAFFYNYNTESVPHLTKKPFIGLFHFQSYEGYLAPETYRVYKDATIKDIIEKLLEQRDKEFVTSTYDRINELTRMHILDNYMFVAGNQLLTMASIIEKEVKDDGDRAKVADILWRRIKRGMPLQVDSSVHYAIDKTGDVFTTEKEREVDSYWNTYRYKGLPPGPICNPGLESIKAALYSEENEYWYFLSGRDGKMYYAKTLEEHNRNKRYL